MGLILTKFIPENILSEFFNNSLICFELQQTKARKETTQ